MSTMKKLVCALAVSLSLMLAPILAKADTTTGQQPAVQTSISPTQLIAVLRDAHAVIFGTAPSMNRLAMAWAQIALENGQGQFVYNHNLGNVVPITSKQPWFYIADHNKYRSFASFDESAQMYWAVIKSCAPAIRQFDAGQAATAAAALKNCKYYDADVGPYAAQMSSLFRFAITTVIPKEFSESKFKSDIRRLIDG